jgi:hypothetical protein
LAKKIARSSNQEATSTCPGQALYKLHHWYILMKLIYNQEYVRTIKWRGVSNWQNRKQFFTLVRPQCFTIEDGTVIGKDVNTIDSPYYVFVALCIVVIVVSLIKIAASNENIECFREYFAVGYRAPDPSFL